MDEQKKFRYNVWGRNIKKKKSKTSGETMQIEHEKGITLIALVIAVIVLIILATIGIVTIMGDQGIFEKANLAVDKHKRGEYNEELILKWNELRPEGIVEGWSSEHFLQKYYEAMKDEMQKESLWQGAKIRRYDENNELIVSKITWLIDV